MSMSDNVPGSKWWKFDFHTHTPASNDYGRGNSALKEITPEDWLQKAMEAELDCVAVTDHNSGNWVDKLKDAYVRLSEQEEKPTWFRPIVIFPGVEITVADSRGRVHLLAIFDPSCDTQKISGLLGACGITENHGDCEKISTEKGFYDVVQCIKKVGAVPIPAHIDSSKGLLENIKSLNSEIKKSLLEIHAAEFCNTHFPTDITTELENYLRLLGRVEGSDAHIADEIGQRFSWIKMSQPSIKELWLALYDYHFCIKNQPESPNTTPDVFLTELTIQNMQHCGRINNKPFTMTMHPHFNTIIGGRGTGKSTVLEAIRIVARRDEILEIEAPKIKEKLDKFMALNTGVILNNTELQLKINKLGKKYNLRWRHDAQGARLEENINSSWVPCEAGNIIERFQIAIFSQKQVYELATNSRGLMKIIDESPAVNYMEWQVEWENNKSDYLQLKEKYRNLLRQLDEMESMKAKLKDIEDALNHYEEKGHGDILKNYQKHRQQESSFLSEKIFDDIEKSLNNAASSIVIPDFMSDSFKEDDSNLIEMQSIHDVAKAKLLNLKNDIFSIVATVDSIKNEYFQSIGGSNWSSSLKQSIQDYETIEQSYKVNNTDISLSIYNMWITERNDLQEKIKILVSKESDIVSIEGQLKSLYLKSINLRENLYKKRKSFIDSVVGENNFVKMEIIRFGDLYNLEMDYRSLLGIEAGVFSSSILEKENSNSILWALAMCLENNVQIEELIKIIDSLKEDTRQIAVGKKSAVHGAFNNRLQSIYKNNPTVFDLLDIWWPEDLLQVKYAKEPSASKFEILEKGSAGQKSAAVLAFLLSYGSWPILIDQPEDDLDNSLIYDLIVKQIREKKNNRQVIIITHNANIVVNGDSELVNIMKVHRGQVQLSMQGGLGEREIREGVCAIMEGGEEAFDMRYKRLFLYK